jgi:hypothetical protein
MVFFVVWIFLWGWIWLVQQIIPANISPDPLLRPYMGVTPETNQWLEGWQRWDTLHYQAIAEHGYTAFATAMFTPPFYPLLMHVTAPLFGGNTLASGLFISSLSFLGCLIVFFHLARLELPEQKDALRTVMYLAFFPTAFFLFAAYSESLFLLAVLLCFYATRKNQWLLAGLFGALASFTRIPGPFLIFPLGWAAWEAWQAGDRRGWVAPILTGVGATIYPLYVWLGLGLPPIAILNALNKRGGYATFPGLNLIESVNRILHGQLWEENLMELVFSLLFITLTIFVWKSLPRIYGVYSVTFMFLFLTRFGSPQPLVSMARYVLEIFPAFMVLAVWGHNTRVNRIILYLFWLGLLFFSAQFAIWGWVG